MNERDKPDAPRRRGEPILRPHKPSEPILRPPERRPILTPDPVTAARTPAPPAPSKPARAEPPAPLEPEPPAAQSTPEPVEHRRRAPLLADEAVEPGVPIVERAARIALVAGIFAVPVVFDTRTLDVFNLAKITALWTFVLAALGLTVAATVLGRRGSFVFRSPTVMLAVALLAVTGLATAFSTNRTLSIYGLYHRYDGLVSLAIYIAAAALVVALYSRRPRALTEVAIAIVASAVVVAGYAVLQRAGHDPFHWVVGTGTPPSRPVATLGNADAAAALLALALPFAVYLAATWRHPALRVSAAAAGALVLAGLLVTRSGIGLAAAIGGLIALVVFASDARPAAKMAAVAVMLAAAVVSPVVVSHSTGSLHYRLQIWKAAWRMTAHRPVLGNGPETFFANYPRFRSASEAALHGLTIPDAPRNIYLARAASTGFAGLLVYLALAASVLWLIARRTRDRPRSTRLLAAAIGGAFVAYLIQGAFSVDVPALALAGWVPVGAAVALLEHTGAECPSTVSFAPWRVAAAVVAVIVAGAGIWAGFGPLRADHAAWASDRTGGGWSDDAARLHAKAIRLNRREAAYRSLAGAYFERVAGVEGTPIPSRSALLAAGALYKAAVALQPRNPYFVLDLGRVYARIARRHPEYYSTADEWMRRAVAIDPLDPQVHALRATVLRQWAKATKQADLQAAIAGRAHAEARAALALARQS